MQGRPAAPSSSPHAAFFSSLEQVERRLAIEADGDPHRRFKKQRHQDSPSPLPPCSPWPVSATPCSPLFLLSRPDPELPAAPPLPGESSGPASDFLSSNSCGSQEQHPSLVLSQRAEAEQFDSGDGADEIGMLISLLGLSSDDDSSASCDRSGRDRDFTVDDGDTDGSAGCDCSGRDGFRARVLGVKGPKCAVERRRLDKWLQNYHQQWRKERIEPARLAFLLLAKAHHSEVHVVSGTSRTSFPDAVAEFLDYDPPLSLEEGR